MRYFVFIILNACIFQHIQSQSGNKKLMLPQIKKTDKELQICTSDFRCTSGVDAFLIVDMRLFLESIRSVEYEFFEMLAFVQYKPLNKNKHTLKKLYEVGIVETALNGYKEDMTKYIKDATNDYDWKNNKNITYASFREYRRYSRKSYYRYVKTFTDYFIGLVGLPVPINTVLLGHMQEGVRYLVMNETLRMDAFEKHMICNLTNICPEKIIREFFEDMVNDVLYLTDDKLKIYVNGMAPRLQNSIYFRKMDENNLPIADNIICVLIVSRANETRSYIKPILKALRNTYKESEWYNWYLQVETQKEFNVMIDTLEELYPPEQIQFLNLWYRVFTDFAYGYDKKELPDSYVEGVFQYFEDNFASSTDFYVKDNTDKIKNSFSRVTDNVLDQLRSVPKCTMPTSTTTNSTSTTKRSG